mmetsp:Transcript_13700/g.20041  ORF Transcript_13700/g.20041 Transcript_13700/m.20041 type:complete len:112 (+) Transcript_13700:613-948(+)
MKHLLDSVQTSYVTVEPRKKSSQHPSSHDDAASQHTKLAASESGAASAPTPITRHKQMSQQHRGDKKPHHGKKGNPLRRSRIIITVRRTEDYKKWLEENDVDDDSTPVALS